MVFSPEATGQICDILNRVAFSAIAYYHGSSFLREHLDDQVFDRGFNLRDDGTDTSGLAFPFDLEGTAKRPVDMISKGTPKTPAVDQRQAAQLGLSATAHAIGGNDARAMNLFMLPGESDDRQVSADSGRRYLDRLARPGRVLSSPGESRSGVELSASGESRWQVGRGATRSDLGRQSPAGPVESHRCRLRDGGSSQPRRLSRWYLRTFGGHRWCRQLASRRHLDSGGASQENQGLIINLVEAVLEIDHRRIHGADDLGERFVPSDSQEIHKTLHPELLVST